MRKNISGQTIAVFLQTNTGAPYTNTDAPPVIDIVGDNGSMATGAGTISHKGKGEWVYLWTQSETNVNRWGILFSGDGVWPKFLQGWTISYDPHNTNGLGLAYLNAAVGDRPSTGSFPSNFGALSITEAGRMDVGRINGIDAAAVLLAMSAGSMQAGLVDTTAFSPTTTEFESNINVSAEHNFIGQSIRFVSGALSKQACLITGYILNSGRGHFTVKGPASDELTAPPSNGDAFVVF